MICRSVGAANVWRRRRFWRVAAAALLTATASGGAIAQQGGVLDVAGPSGCDPGEREIRFAHAYAEKGHPIGEAALRLATEVNRTLDGRVCASVHPNGVLAAEGAEIDAVLRGAAEMAAPSVSAFDRYTRAFEIFDLPFLFLDQAAAEWFQNSGPGQRLRRELQGTGLLGLSFWNAGMRQIAAVRPVLAPEDARGLVIRVGDSAVMKAVVRRLGATPREVALGAVREALEQGVVEGEEDSWANIYLNRFFELQNGVTESSHGVLAHLVVVSERFWDGLPIRDRRDLKRLMARLAAQANANARKIDRRNRDLLQRSGVEIRLLTPAQREVWVAALRPIWTEFAPLIGETYIEAAVTANR